MVSMAVAQFLEETKLAKKSKAHAAYDTSLRYFMEPRPKLYLEDLQRSDLLKFPAFLRDEKELHPRKERLATLCGRGAGSTRGRTSTSLVPP
jgi:hypothetical protein